MTEMASQTGQVTVPKVSFPHGQHQVVGNLFLPSEH